MVYASSACCHMDEAGAATTRGEGLTTQENSIDRRDGGRLSRANARARSGNKGTLGAEERHGAATTSVLLYLVMLCSATRINKVR